MDSTEPCTSAGVACAPAKPAPSRQQRDWGRMPAGVLQHMYQKLSIWQAPAPSPATPVCRAWQAAATAAAGCGVTHQLYVAGYPAADACFGTWIGRCSQQLECLVFSSDDPDTASTLLGALADAGAAAAAAGHPLPLHTLRVLGAGLEVDLIGRLLAGLPNLRCLQLEVETALGASDQQTAAAVQHLAAFSTASQLQKLYLRGPPVQTDCIQQVADLLPTSLVRLSWCGAGAYPCVPNLTHLSQLTFLRLEAWRSRPAVPLGSHLPPGLKQLQLEKMHTYPTELEGQGELLTGFDGVHDHRDVHLKQQSGWANLRSLSAVRVLQLGEQQVCVVLQQLTKLSALGVDASGLADDLQPVVSVAATLKSLRHLHLKVTSLRHRPGHLSALTQLTRLRVSLGWCLDQEPQQRKWQQQRHQQLQAASQQQQPDHSRGMDDMLWMNRKQHQEALHLLGEMHWKLQQLRQRDQQQAPPPPPQQQHHQPEPWRAWVTNLGSMSWLRWLSVPAALLTADQGWLGGMEQLQVLVLGSGEQSPGSSQQVVSQVVQWLGECDLQQLPPRLLLLGLTGTAAPQAVPWQVRGRLQQLLSSRGCELVVGVDLDEVCDPVMQLAGLPAALQHALA